MQPQFRSFAKSGWLGSRNCSLPPRKFVLVAAGGVSGNPLPYCRNAPIDQSFVTVATSRFENHLWVVYRIFALNRNGWSVVSSDLMESTNRFGRIPTSAFDQVNVPLTCNPCEKRLVPFICRESYQVRPVGELMTPMVLNCGNGRNAFNSVLLAE